MKMVNVNIITKQVISAGKLNSEFMTHNELQPAHVIQSLVTEFASYSFQLHNTWF